MENEHVDIFIRLTQQCKERAKLSTDYINFVLYGQDKRDCKISDNTKICVIYARLMHDN